MQRCRGTWLLNRACQAGDSGNSQFSPDTAATSYARLPSSLSQLTSALFRLHRHLHTEQCANVQILQISPTIVHQPCRLTVTAALPQASCRSEQEKLEHKNKRQRVLHTCRLFPRVQKPESSIDLRSVNPQHSVSFLPRRAILSSGFFLAAMSTDPNIRSLISHEEYYIPSADLFILVSEDGLLSRVFRYSDPQLLRWILGGASPIPRASILFRQRIAMVRRQAGSPSIAWRQTDRVGPFDCDHFG